MTLELDDYERDNLLALLNLIYPYTADGVRCLDTGDWVGQIYWKLAPRGFDPAIHKPNAKREDMIASLREWAVRKP